MTTTPSGTGWLSLQQFLKDNPEYRIYDFSQLETWSTCPRKYQYLYRLELEEASGIAALFSKHCLHPLVGMFYQALASDDIPGVFAQIPECYQKFTNALQSQVYQPVALKYSQVYTISTLELCMNTLYNHFYNDRGLLTWNTTEMVYWRVLPGIPNSVWLAKPDMVLLRPDSKLITVDIKLSAYDIHSNLNEFDRQFLSQVWAAQAQFMCKLFFHINIDTKGKVKGVTINRSIVAPEQDQLSEWLTETCEIISHVQSNTEHQTWPKRSPRSCYDFNHACMFIELCALGSARELAIENYPKRDSLKYLQEE